MSRYEVAVTVHKEQSWQGREQIGATLEEALAATRTAFENTPGSDRKHIQIARISESRDGSAG
jgi:hypothetical protein